MKSESSKLYIYVYIYILKKDIYKKLQYIYRKKLKLNQTLKSKITLNWSIYLFNSLSTPYRLFNAKI